MGIESLGEGRPFERDHRDSFALEAREEPSELAAQDEMTRGAVDEVAMQPLSHGCWHRRGRIRLARKPERRPQAFGRGRSQEEVPVEGIAGNDGRAAPGEGAEALDDPAGLGAQGAGAGECSIEAGITEEPASCAFTSACSQFAVEGP